MNNIDDLFLAVKARADAEKPKSHTAKLQKKGTEKICQKIGEEAAEVIIAALAEGKKELKSECSDLLYHLMVLWIDQGIEPQEVLKILEKRIVKQKKA